MAKRKQDVPRLVITSPADLRGRIFPLTRRATVIGHSKTAHLILEDTSVSRRPALITISESGSATLYDLNSSGGTRRNSERVTGPRILRAGDVIAFAVLTARFDPAWPDPARSDLAGTAGPARRPAPVREPPTRPLPRGSGSAALPSRPQAASPRNAARPGPAEPECAP